MGILVEDYVSGGYLITLYADGASSNRWLRSAIGATEDLLPARMLSVGYCGASRAPSLRGDFDEEKCARFGVSPARKAEVISWVEERLDREVGFPDLFFRLPTAREYIRRFTSGAADIQLLGIGLHQERLHHIAQLERLRPPGIAETGAKLAGFADTGFAQALRLGERPAAGEILGFDVICCYWNIDHSWHCNGLVVDGLDRFGFRPNQFGLINEKTNADKVADYANEIPTEEGIWLPVLVTRYSVSEQT